MSESLITLLITILLIAAIVGPFTMRMLRREREAAERQKELRLEGKDAALTMHPHIDVLTCIGCGSCVAACPEGDVLAVVQGKSVLVYGAKCVGHGLCADACPVGAISLLMMPPGRSATLPVLSASFETTIHGIYIAGELGGIGLIKNAVTQGRMAAEAAAQRKGTDSGALDVVIVGAGPAGLTAGLTAQQRGLRYAILEQGDVGGTILRYPRRKLVLTSPVELPMWGKLRATEVSKEDLLDLWNKIIAKTGLQVNSNEKMLEIQPAEGIFRVRSAKTEYLTRTVILAMGRRGVPRRLDVPGEELPKVVYELMDAEQYTAVDVLVVGGGDSAVETAIALARQKNNRVTLSYRKPEFSRIKDRNAIHLREQVKGKNLNVVMNSTVDEIHKDRVYLSTPERRLEIKNDHVFVCVGGEMPFAQLADMGIKFHRQEVGVPGK
jgi:thioredoxin reductase (NADPH)